MTYTKQELAQVKDLEFKQSGVCCFVAITPFFVIKIDKSYNRSSRQGDRYDVDYVMPNNGPYLSMPGNTIYMLDKEDVFDYINALYKEAVLKLKSQLMDAVDV